VNNSDWLGLAGLPRDTSPFALRSVNIRAEEFPAFFFGVATSAGADGRCSWMLLFAGMLPILVIRGAHLKT
jgi:hypothetical protein